MLTSTVLPPAARLAWWGTAFLGGLIGPDEVQDGLLGHHDDPDRDLNHLVLGETGVESVLLELAAARNAGCTGVGAAFPAPGDPFGLAGPPALTGAAVDAGEVALLLGIAGQPGAAAIGLVPHQVGRAVEWSSYPAARRPAPDLGEADRGLRSAVLEAAKALAALDVAHWRPEVADELMDRPGPLPVPPGVPPRCVDLAARAIHLWHVVELALRDDGGAVSATEAAARQDAIGPLARAVRRALTAAFSPDGWPPA